MLPSEDQHTYSPGLPVHVEKLKKYRAKPIASPGTSRDPENTRSAFAMRVSKICFLIYERIWNLWNAGRDHYLDAGSPVWGLLPPSVVIFRRQPAPNEAMSEYNPRYIRDRLMPTRG